MPAAALNGLRFFYSPRYRMGRRAARLRRRIEAAGNKVADVSNGRVLKGPFQGMKYIQESVCSALPPKILGTYEMELHALIEAIVAGRPSCIIDIGAAEGFYAVGLAMRLPNTRVIAFESDPHGRELLFQLASMNGVTGSIELQGSCSLEALEKSLATPFDRCVILCDAEGAEYELLDPSRVPMLARISLLVELHPWVHPDIKAILTSRFNASSTITTVESRLRATSDFPLNSEEAFSEQNRLDCMNELRPCQMEWMWIKPKKELCV